MNGQLQCYHSSVHFGAVILNNGLWIAKEADDKKVGFSCLH